MLQALRDIIGNRRVTPAAPPTFAPVLPAEDEPALVALEEEEPELESVTGIGCIITYKDSKGGVSIRRITCQRLSKKGSTLYLQAFCHERAALRTFRLDRMDEVACGVTGEVFIPGECFFDAFGIASEGGAAVGFGLNVRLAADLRAGLNVLTFLARADGKFVAEELEVVEGFCQAFGLRIASGSFDYEGTARYAARLAPDAETFYLALRRLTRDGAPEGLAALTKRYAGDLIAADGVQDPKEFYFANEILEFSE